MTKTKRKKTPFQAGCVKKILAFAGERKTRRRFYGLTDVYVVSFHHSADWALDDMRYKDVNLGALMDWCDEHTDGRVKCGAYWVNVTYRKRRSGCTLRMFCVLIKP